MKNGKMKNGKMKKLMIMMILDLYSSTFNFLLCKIRAIYVFRLGGCPDTDGDGKTNQVEGTEDEDDSGGFGLPSLSFAGTLWMIVGVAILLQRKNSDEDTHLI